MPLPYTLWSIYIWNVTLYSTNSFNFSVAQDNSLIAIKSWTPYFWGCTRIIPCQDAHKCCTVCRRKNEKRKRRAPSARNIHAPPHKLTNKSRKAWNIFLFSKLCNKVLKRHAKAMEETYQKHFIRIHLKKRNILIKIRGLLTLTRQNVALRAFLKSQNLTNHGGKRMCYLIFVLQNPDRCAGSGFIAYIIAFKFD